MSLRSIACLCAALSFSPLTALPVGAEQAPLDIKIVNGRVLDGSGNAWFLADVGVRDGRIVEVGDLSDAAAKREVDATGLVVAPGFIDVHTHADGDVFDLPLATNFVRDGVTTIVTGNCGGSVLDVGEYLDRVDRDGVGVNVATLIGHNSVIREQKGSVAEQVTDEQLEAARARVRKAMEEGAVGMSTGLIYLPGLWSPTEEIIELQRVAAEYGGIYATHMRNEGTGIMAAIDEALRVGEETGSRVQISHFKLPAHAQRLLGNTATMEKVFAARARGMEVWVDQYPYTASSTGITTLLPDWVLENGGEAARKILQDEEQVARVRQEMAEGIVRSQRGDYTYCQVANARAFPEYSGKRIPEIAIMRREVPRDEPATIEEQIDTIIAIYLNGGAGMVYHTMKEDAVESIMRSPLVSIASDSGIREFGVGVPHPRGYGTNARVLGEYARERGVLTLEEAIRKMTSMPARAFRFSDRGLIQPGFAADIVVFDPTTITDNATFTEPHQYSTGFALVMVNGVPVVENDEITGERPGKALRGPGWKPAENNESGG